MEIVATYPLLRGGAAAPI